MAKATYYLLQKKTGYKITLYGSYEHAKEQKREVNQCDKAYRWVIKKIK